MNVAIQALHRISLAQKQLSCSNHCHVSREETGFGKINDLSQGYMINSTSKTRNGIEILGLLVSCNHHSCLIANSC